MFQWLALSLNAYQLFSQLHTPDPDWWLYLNSGYWMTFTDYRCSRAGSNEAIAQNGVLDLLMNIFDRSELRKCSMQFGVIVVFYCSISGWLYYSFPWFFKWHSLPMLLLLCLSSSVCGCVIWMCEFVFLLICCRYFLFYCCCSCCVRNLKYG